MLYLDVPDYNNAISNLENALKIYINQKESEDYERLKAKIEILYAKMRVSGGLLRPSWRSSPRKRKIKRSGKRKSRLEGEKTRSGRKNSIWTSIASSKSMKLS